MRKEGSLSVANAGVWGIGIQHTGYCATKHRYCVQWQHMQQHFCVSRRIFLR